MLQYAKENCSRLPRDFEANIQDYFQHLYQPDQQQKAVLALDSLLDNLKHLIEASI
jgi:hypothetical protein